jgi:transposase-like protein
MEAEHARILSASATEGLTGKQTSAEFGVSGVTLWKWRRDAKDATAKHRPRDRRSLRSHSLDSLPRSQVRGRIQQLQPEIVPDEVAA